ncbi:hypothetical protein GF376_02970 [Candidatus Peregrinibacteria bacterium]|nr:hypothetical protein [Candidatus Peregrinibacteria bacterium]
MKKEGNKIGKTIIIAWLVLATGYVAINEYFRLNNFVYASGFSAGQESAVSELIKLSGQCEPIPVFMNDQQVELINVACLQQQAAPTQGEMNEANITGPNGEPINNPELAQ